MPLLGSGSSNNPVGSELFWILEIELRRREIVDAVPIAYMMKQDMYPNSNSLLSQEISLFPT